MEDQKKYTEAIKLYDDLIIRNRSRSELFFRRGNINLILKSYHRALSDYQEVINLNPNSLFAYHNMGIVLVKMEEYCKAIKYYDKALTIDNKFIKSLIEKSKVYRLLRNYQLAHLALDEALKIDINESEIYLFKGILLHECKQFPKAIQNYDIAIKIYKDNPIFYYNKAMSLNELNIIEDAIRNLEISYSLNEKQNYLLGYLILFKLKICDWSNISILKNKVKKDISKYKKVITPLTSALVYDDNILSRQVATIFTKNLINGINNSEKIEVINVIKNEKIKIAYFSSDFYYHPVAIWLVEQLKNHDKSKFELHGFCLRNVKDQMRDKLQSFFDYWYDVESISNDAIYTKCRELQIDIAIDLNGHTADSRTTIFVKRVAPIQVSHLGFPGTMGAEYIDYFLTDRHVVPEQASHHFTEKIAYVPCAYTYDRQRLIGSEPLNRSQFGLPDNSFVFTCQNGCQKITPEVFDVWMDLLITVPHSVLWLLEPHPAAVKNLRKEALVRGVESERLIFTKREVVPQEQEMSRIGRYLGSYKLADLFLDTWPYNAGTTAVDALWAGLPVLTKSGETVVARMATSALQAIEIPELITSTPQEYRNLAIELATNSQRLKLIKEKIKRNRLTTALFDPVTNTKHIEAAYLEMYQRFQKGLPPENLNILG